MNLWGRGVLGVYVVIENPRQAQDDVNFNKSPRKHKRFRGLSRPEMKIFTYYHRYDII